MNSILIRIIGCLLIAFVLISPACKKETGDPVPMVSVPVVTMDSVRYNHFTSVFCIGTVLDTGSSYVQQFGFCWSKDHDPVVNGLGTTSIYSPYLEYSHFSEIVEPLDYGNTYYIRAFASNKDGFGYAEEIEIQTNAEARTFYIGQWLVTETFSKMTYIVNITTDLTSGTDVSIYNFANLGGAITARAQVSGPTITLPLDHVLENGFIVNGSGSVSEDDKILWNYSLNDGADLLQIIATYSLTSR